MESKHRQLIVNELDPKRLETSYQIHRVLCDQSYSLGQSLSEFVSEFAATSPPGVTGRVAFVKTMVDKAVNTFFSQHNLGLRNSSLRNCRPVVEKFLFSRLYDQIFPLYIALCTDL
jgi:mannitol-1-phosphate/altronate dehydrogenase